MTAKPDVTELSYLTALLREVAREEIKPRFRRAKTSSKADGSLVTEADTAVQNRLQGVFAERYPDIALLGEEMSQQEQERLAVDDGTAFWCLDPLDGTSNYACGFPGFAISLALVRNGRAELAVILDPVRDECFTAAIGSGAWLNGRPLAPYAPGEALGDCLAVVDFKRLPPQRVPALFGPGSFRSQRNVGAVALEWCWIASGRFQLYLHGGQKLWDYAAGRLIADEAGVVSALFAPDGAVPLHGIGLDKRVAVAAATRGLYEAWLDFVDLPLRRAS
ncbi:MAG: inositol monophosphatase family protein [Thiohalocapsa sp.]|nr:inositol monophosphatase family protein [Thiohalocapsa sp.]MCF7990697.1 inositol monophosphatase family protein [Thiohalocapsa sp.]